MTRPVVSIVVLNWNGGVDTLACLDSLSTIRYPNFSAVVVDNGSTDDSLALLRPYTAPYPLALIETGRNLGFAGGNNVGIRHALEHGADYVLLLNNDTTVAADLLDRLVAAAERHPDAGVLSARIFYTDKPNTVCFDGAHWNPPKLHFDWPGQEQSESDLSADEHDSDYASGAALFFRAEVAAQIGVLDDRFFLVWEEVDWCYRARKSGWRCLVIPNAKIWHRVGASFGSEASPLRTYFSVRNRFLWFRLHMPLHDRIKLWIRLLPQLLPESHIASTTGTELPKRFIWALDDLLRSLLGRGSRFTYLATRRAIVDYLRSRFGDCPPEVRAWNQAWSEARHAEHPTKR